MHDFNIYGCCWTKPVEKFLRFSYLSKRLVQRSELAGSQLSYCLHILFISCVNFPQAWDRLAIKLRGRNAVTNFSLTEYKAQLRAIERTDLESLICILKAGKGPRKLSNTTKGITNSIILNLTSNNQEYNSLYYIIYSFNPDNDAIVILLIFLRPFKICGCWMENERTAMAFLNFRRWPKSISWAIWFRRRGCSSSRPFMYQGTCIAEDTYWRLANENWISHCIPRQSYWYWVYIYICVWKFQKKGSPRNLPIESYSHELDLIKNLDADRLIRMIRRKQAFPSAECVDLILGEPHQEGQTKTAKQGISISSFLHSLPLN